MKLNGKLRTKLCRAEISFLKTHLWYCAPERTVDCIQRKIQSKKIVVSGDISSLILFMQVRGAGIAFPALIFFLMPFAPFQNRACIIALEYYFYGNVWLQLIIKVIVIISLVV